ncbi:MAG: methylenetetrahydrofolate reductase [Rhodospirillaceae bacterium]|nr:methylenetetrahydrofolate reductase [Rhodospirillaceae bacterium]
MTELKSAGRLEATLRAGHFALTAETTPPDAAGADAVLRKAGCLKGLADAVNVTDAAGARAHMGALPASAILAREGIEPVLQFTMRDRNRIAMQGDLIGAAALGIPNILSLYGDDPKGGDQPDAKPVHDIDGRQFLTMTRAMRDTGAFPSGRKIEPAPRLFLGAADSPREPDAKWKPDGLLAKIDSGADFIQTQYCFDMALLRRYMAALADHGIPERIFILVGIGPIASAKGGRWMNENLHGVHVPDALIARLETAQDQAAEGRRICVELLHELTEIPGVAGAHLMAPRGEQAAADVIAESGLLARRAA